MITITVKQARQEDVAALNAMEERSFETTKRYFPDGVLPGLPPEEREKHDFAFLLTNSGSVPLTITADGELVGGAAVKNLGEGVREVELFFIDPNAMGKGIGRRALAAVENFFPGTKLWRLITPTQVLKNVVFYVNKCGYRIVKLEDFDREANSGIFVFEKTGE